jgi:hypothetical protein
MPKFLGNFFRSKSCALILTKNGLGKILDTFLTNSSGHPANDQNRIDAILESCRMRVARHEIHCSCKQTFREPSVKENLWNVVEIIKKATRQGCQMVCCKTKIPNFGKFWMALE